MEGGKERGRGGATAYLPYLCSIFSTTTGGESFVVVESEDAKVAPKAEEVERI